MGKHVIEWICPKCGQKTEEQVECKWRDLDWETKKRQDTLCPDCQEKEDEELLAALQKKNYSYKMPVLNGSKKQIEWAEQIRNKQYESLTALKSNREGKFMVSNWKGKIERFPDSENVAIWQACINNFEYYVQDEIEELLEETSAGRIIDGRDKEWKVRIENRARDERERRLSKERGPKEILLVPNGPKKNLTVSLHIKDNCIYTVGEYNPKLITCYKEARMKWNSFERIWWKSNQSTMTSTTDSAADLANSLLLAGFCVKVPRLIGEMVESKNFVPDKKTWIELRDDFYCTVRTVEKNAEPIVNAATRIFGKKDYYGHPYTEIYNYQAVKEFADLYDVALDSDVIKAIEKQKALQKNIDPLMPQPPRDGLKEILNSSREVLDDLKD